MKIEKIKKVYFSPTGTTKKTIDTIASVFNLPFTEIDLFRNTSVDEITVEENELLIIALPVFYGRIPEICNKTLFNLKSTNSLAIAAVVYGNRDYDDALLELCDILAKNDFGVIGAGAFLAQHSRFPLIGKNRPDVKDIEITIDFSKKCNDIIGSVSSKPIDEISVKGNKEYCKVNPGFIPQKVNDNCTNCGICTTLCPVNAIDPESPQKIDAKICLSCGGCIYNCPKKARSFTGEAYKMKEEIFSTMCSEYKTPELFYI